MEQIAMFAVWIVFGIWLFACLRKVKCVQCIIVRYTGLIICLILISILL